MINRPERGSILITSLIFMLILTIMLMAFVDMSTTGLKQTTYAEQRGKAFYSSDGGISYTGKMLDTIMSKGYDCGYFATDFPIATLEKRDFSTLETKSGTVTCSSLVQNLKLGANDTDREVTLAMGDASVYLDIQRVGSAEFTGSSSGEFASGYEGIGGGMSSGGTTLYFSMDAVGKSTLGAKSSIYAVYKKIP